MDFYDIDKFDKEKLIEKFNQSSNVFAYYILKCIITNNFCNIILELDHFKHLIDSNKNSICNINSCKSIANYINDSLQNLPIKLINKTIKKLESYDNSLRMTIFGSY